MKWEDVMLMLKKRRMELGLSIEKVAFLLDTSSSYVSRSERGLICPSIKFVCEYAIFLGTRVQLYGLSFI